MSNRVQYLNWTCNSSVLQITLRGIIFNTDREFISSENRMFIFSFKAKSMHRYIGDGPALKISKDNILELSLGTFNHKRQKPIKIKLSTKILNELKDKKIQQIELIYKHQLLLSFMYRVEENVLISNHGLP